MLVTTSGSWGTFLLKVFTGIVAEIGIVRLAEDTPSGRRLEIGSTSVRERLAIGDSVAVAGVCLTVTLRDDHGFTVDVVPETIARTTLGHAARGTHVDLEPAATPTTALGGHFVQGHIDTTVALRERTREGDGARLRFALPKGNGRYVVKKGFVTLDGVSLTVAALDRSGFEVALIPHTAAHTTFGALRAGDLVNFEADIIGKYVERLLGERKK